MDIQSFIDNLKGWGYTNISSSYWYDPSYILRGYQVINFLPTGIGSGTTSSVFIYAMPPSNSDIVPPTLISFNVTPRSNSNIVDIDIVDSDNVGVGSWFIGESYYSGKIYTTKPTSYTFTNIAYNTDVQKTLYCRSTDRVGLTSQTLSKTITLNIVDNTPPTITEFTTDSVSSRHITGISLKATDNIEVSGYAISSVDNNALQQWSSIPPTEFIFSAGTSGLNNLYAYVKDGAGNITKESIVVNIPESSIITTEFDSFYSYVEVSHNKMFESNFNYILVDMKSRYSSDVYIQTELKPYYAWAKSHDNIISDYYLTIGNIATSASI